MSLESLESASWWFTVAAIALPVLGGVAAFLALYFASRAGAIRDDSLERFKVTSATTIAAADTRAAEANEKAAEAGVVASGANERAGALELDAAKARERAANAERALLELQQKIAPRHIPDATRVRLIEALKQSQTKGEIDIECVAGDAESAAFAKHVLDILRASGWQTTPINTGLYAGGAPVGFGIMVHSLATTPPHALSLHAAFRSAGFDLGEIIESAGVQDGDVKLMVGHKRQ